MDTSLWIDKDVAAVDAVDAGLLLLSLCKSKNIVYMGYIGTVIQNVAYITNLLLNRTYISEPFVTYDITHRQKLSLVPSPSMLQKLGIS